MCSEQLLLEPEDGWQRAATVSPPELVAPRGVSLLSPCCWSKLPGHLLRHVGSMAQDAASPGVAFYWSKEGVIMSLE